MCKICIALTAVFLVGTIAVQAQIDLGQIYRDRLSIYVDTYAGSQLKGYYQGTCEIRSGNEVAIGMDSNADGSYDKFFGLQTDNEYDVTRTAEGCEVIYIEHLVIYRSLDDDFVATLSFRDFEGVREPWGDVPQEIRVKSGDHNYYGYGVRAHFGEGYTFKDFMD